MCHNDTYSPIFISIHMTSRNKATPKSQSGLSIQTVAVVGLLAAILGLYIYNQINPAGAYLDMPFDREVFVSTAGRDTNPGTADQPFRSLYSAFATLRSDESVKISVIGPEYRMTAADLSTGGADKLIVPVGADVLLTSPAYAISTGERSGIPNTQDPRALPNTFIPGTKMIGLSGRDSLLRIADRGNLVVLGFEWDTIRLEIEPTWFNTANNRWTAGRYVVVANVFNGTDILTPSQHRFGSAKGSFVHHNIFNVRNQVTPLVGTESAMSVYDNMGWPGDLVVEGNLFAFPTLNPASKFQSGGIVPVLHKGSNNRFRGNSFITAELTQGLPASDRQVGFYLPTSNPALASQLLAENDFSQFGGSPIVVIK